MPGIGKGYVMWCALPKIVSVCCFTGTALFYRPGMLSGGTLEHDCSKQRAIGYFLEPLMMLAPFTKLPLKVTLRGVTSGPHDPSVR